MKSYILALILSVLFVSGFGQQITLSNLYTNNTQSINPAFSSIGDYNAFSLNHRNQWSNFDDKLTTSFISGNYNIDKNNGIGGNMYLESLGLIRQLYVLPSYSRRFKLGKNSISLGGGIGLHQQSIAFNDIIAEDYTDNILTQNSNSGVTFINELGMMFRSKKLTLGLSAPQIIQSKISTTKFQLERQYNLYSSYNINAGEKLNIIPNAYFRFISVNNHILDANMDFIYNKNLMIGFGYRDNSSLLLRTGLRLKEKIEIAYSFESFFNKNSNNLLSHEISLAYKVFKPKDEEVPENTSLIDSTPVIINDSVILVYKDENDSIIRHRFLNIEALRDFTIKHKEKDNTIEYLVNQKLEHDPDITVLNLLMQQDSLYTVEIEDNLGHVKKHRFITLQELHDFNYNLQRENPILSAKLRHEIDIHPDYKTYHIIQPKFDNYEIDVFDSTTNETKKFKFQNIESLNDFLIKTEREDKSLYNKILKRIYAEPELNLFLVNDNSLKEAKNREEELKTIDENQNTNEKPIILIYKDDNNKIVKHEFKNIDALRDFTSQNKETDYTLDYLVNQKLAGNPNLQDLNLLDEQKEKLYTVEIVDSEGHVKLHRFITLQELHDFNYELQRENPVFSAKLKNEISAHPEFRLFHIEETQTVVKDEKFKFQNINQMNDYVLNIENVDPQLKAELQKLIDQNPQYFVNTGTLSEKPKYKFKNIAQMNDFLLDFEKTNPTLFSRMMNGLDNNELKIQEEKVIVEEKLSISKDELIAICNKINLTFGLNKTNTDHSEFKNLLIELVSKLNQSNYKLNIIGHTCDLGTDAINNRVGLDRAKSMKNILSKKGVNLEKITTSTSGSSKPKVPNTSEENRKKNRRVELIIL